MKLETISSYSEGSGVGRLFIMARLLNDRPNVVCDHSRSHLDREGYRSNKVDTVGCLLSTRPSGHSLPVVSRNVAPTGDMLPVIAGTQTTFAASGGGGVAKTSAYLQAQAETCAQGLTLKVVYKACNFVFM